MWSQPGSSASSAQANGQGGPERSYGTRLGLFESSGPKTLGGEGIFALKRIRPPSHFGQVFRTLEHPLLALVDGLPVGTLS